MLPANWTFRFHADHRVAQSSAGARRAVIVGSLVPLLLALAPLHALIFDWRIAGLHAGYGLLASLVLLEVLLASFPKVPFAAPYVPGRAMVRSRLTLYFFGFHFFAYVLAGIESLLIVRTVPMAIAMAVLAAAYGYAATRRCNREAGQTLVFEDDSPDAVQTLGLSGPRTPAPRVAEPVVPAPTLQA